MGEFNRTDMQFQLLPRIEWQIGRSRELDPALQPRQLAVAQVDPHKLAKWQIPEGTDTLVEIPERIGEMGGSVISSDQKEFELIG